MTDYYDWYHHLDQQHAQPQDDDEVVVAVDHDDEEDVVVEVEIYHDDYQYSKDLKIMNKLLEKKNEENLRFQQEYEDKLQTETAEKAKRREKKLEMQRKREEYQKRRDSRRASAAAAAAAPLVSAKDTTGPSSSAAAGAAKDTITSPSSAEAAAASAAPDHSRRPSAATLVVVAATETTTSLSSSAAADPADDNEVDNGYDGNSRDYLYTSDGSRIPRWIEVSNSGKEKDMSTTASTAAGSSLSKLEDSLSGETLATMELSFSTIGDDYDTDTEDLLVGEDEDLIGEDEDYSISTAVSDQLVYHDLRISNREFQRLQKEENQVVLRQLLCHQNTILSNQMDSSDKYLDKCLRKMMETTTTDMSERDDDEEEELLSTITAFCNDYHPSSPSASSSSPPTRTYIYDPYNKTKIYLKRHLSFWKIADQSLEDAKKSKLFLQFDTDSSSSPDNKHQQHYDCSDMVEVRGCFDHLHQGHKELLQTALSIAKKFLLVTVVSSPQNKQYMEAYEPLYDREEMVRSYLQELNQEREYPKIYVVNDTIRKNDLADLEIDVGVYGSEYYGCPIPNDASKKLLFVNGHCGGLSTQLRKQELLMNNAGAKAKAEADAATTTGLIVAEANAATMANAAASQQQQSGKGKKKRISKKMNHAATRS